MRAVVQCVIVVAIVGLLTVWTSCKGKTKETKQSAKAAAHDAASASTPAPSAAGAFARDVQRICDATARSGALKVDEPYRAVTVAQWLAQKIESQDGRDLLGRVARLAPKDKAKALRDAAAKIGLPDCETAAAWSGGAP